MPSKHILSIRALALASLLVVPGSFLTTSATAADEKPDTPLHKEMEGMGQAWRVLGRGMRNPDPASKADYLAALQQWQTHAVAAQVLTPAHIAEMPAAEQPAALTAFRSDIAAAIGLSFELERAILADNWDKAKEVAAQINSARSDGHKKYNPEPPKA